MMDALKSYIFQYNMDNNLLENYISKVICPRHLSIEYKFYNNESELDEDYSEFDKYIVRFIKKSGTSLTSIHFESCRNDNVLSTLSECPNLTGKTSICLLINSFWWYFLLAVNFARCKGTFESLVTLRKLEKIEMLLCVFPKSILQETLQNNAQLKTISLCKSAFTV